MTAGKRRVLVTGGGTYLGDQIAGALLAEGAQVTLLVRPGAEERLGALAERTRWYVADVWDPASLRGRARGHLAVVHTVGSMVADPAQGLTHHRLNFLSARNVANMCVSDGAAHMVLISNARAPWISRKYIHSKREAEAYLRRVGIQSSIIRAPITYVRGRPRPLFYQMMTLLGLLPPFSWLGMARMAPMPVDVLARAVARIALKTERERQIYYAPDLRRLNTREELRGQAASVRHNPQLHRVNHPFELLGEDAPFGWTPEDHERDR